MANAVSGASARKSGRPSSSIPGPSTSPRRTSGAPAVSARTAPNSVEVNTAAAEPRELDPKLSARIRASILLAGPMLARFGRVNLPPPGGDVIGRRRVDTHFLALERLGTEITVGATYQLEANTLRGADIFLDEPSVTATENARI